MSCLRVGLLFFPLTPSAPWEAISLCIEALLLSCLHITDLLLPLEGVTCQLYFPEPFKSGPRDTILSVVARMRNVAHGQMEMPAPSAGTVGGV